MRMRLYPIALALLPALGACVPGTAEYTKAEAPSQLRVDGAMRSVALAFAPGSGWLSPGEAAHLDRLVANGSIRAADRVTIAASGPPALADARAAAISGLLLRWGIVAEARPHASVPRNGAIVTVGHDTVSLPPCPNWSQSPASEYTEAFESNWGCAAATNLGLMVAKPADLVNGRSLAAADGMPAANAVNRYLNDRVPGPPSPTASPFAASSGGGPDSAGSPPSAGTP
jgi:pilus assembly protein CpaD